MATQAVSLTAKFVTDIRITRTSYSQQIYVQVGFRVNVRQAHQSVDISSSRIFLFKSLGRGNSCNQSQLLKIINATKTKMGIYS